MLFIERLLRDYKRKLLTTIFPLTSRDLSSNSSNVLTTMTFDVMALFPVPTLVPKLRIEIGFRRGVNNSAHSLPLV